MRKPKRGVFAYAVVGSHRSWCEWYELETFMIDQEWDWPCEFQVYPDKAQGLGWNAMPVRNWD